MSNVIKKVIKNWVEYDIYASGWAAGAGDVTWPSSSTDADIALFNWATGKIIKDSWKKLSDYQTALSTQTAYTTKWTATKVPTITTNTLWQVTAITETNISFPVTSVNGSTWAVTVQPTLESGTNIKTINSNSILWSGNLDIDWLPSQTGQSWKYLTTDWTTASWGTVSGGITNDTTWTTSTVTGIWAWSENEYTALWTKSWTVLYFTF